MIKAIQTLRSGFTDGFMLAATYLGDEIAFLAVAVAIYWCVDTRFGFRLINVYLLGCAAVEGIKGLVARPRPYTYDGIASVGERTSGWSFPSGHSHSIANLSTQLGSRYRRAYVIVPLAVVSCLVAFSRLYLGQHFLSDVLTGLTLGFCFAVLLSRLFDLLGDREEYIAAVVAPLCFILLIVLMLTGAVSGGTLDVLGGYSAVTIGYFVQKRYVGFTARHRSWWRTLLKLALGLAITLGVKEGLKFVFPQGDAILYNFVRYFAVGIVASLAMPALFEAIKL